ncbi:hypothetical protein EXIGLDRAFT_775981 [Exidia glandulosa HHB12029]|uniref:Conidiation protein 6 n=1 Tax=Exidia glandulosa HHB12029 TaxID=1314781 RepID=A0A165DNR3_EXIGL|nr:hypothetical protein EXIGLDRAFT_775981 [Exidia glandulosa HHB12029]
MSASELTSGKNPKNVAGGYKATLNNDSTSKEAKDHARAALDELEESGALNEPKGPARESNVVGGHKANLHNDNTSEESKERSKDFLESKGVSVE